MQELFSPGPQVHHSQGLLSAGIKDEISLKPFDTFDIKESLATGKVKARWW